jgi:hypothetical protein
MRRLLVVAALVVGCQRGGDENLGLGQSTMRAIDVATLSNPEELVRAVSVGGPALDRALGRHRMQASSTVKLELPNHTSEQLDETFDVAFDGKSLRLRHENEQDYGFEAIATGNRLWVRPRYGQYVLRKIEGDELERLRKTAELPAAAWLKLFLPSLQVQEAGRAQIGGRPGVKLALSARPSPGSAPSTSDPQKAWRRTVTVKYLSGDVVVDATNGAPLEVQIDAGFSFEREGKTVNAALSFKQRTLGDAETIVAPTEWTTLVRPRPMLDRQTLLEGLAGVRGPRQPSRPVQP